jgi:hypothetical protein
MQLYGRVRVRGLIRVRVRVRVIGLVRVMFGMVRVKGVKGSSRGSPSDPSLTIAVHRVYP